MSANVQLYAANPTQTWAGVLAGGTNSGFGSLGGYYTQGGACGAGSGSLSGSWILSQNGDGTYALLLDWLWDTGATGEQKLRMDGGTVGNSLTVTTTDISGQGTFTIGAANVTAALCLSIFPSACSSSGLPTVPSIQKISPILPQQTQTITISGTGFGSAEATSVNTPNLRIFDLTGGWAAGYKGSGEDDRVGVQIASWSSTQIVLQGFTGQYGQNNWTLQAGDRLTVEVWNPQSGVAVTAIAQVGASAAATPNISSITPILAQQNQVITIAGTGFGNAPPSALVSGNLRITDNTSGWSAGYIGGGISDMAGVNISSWTDTEIVLTGFTGSYGQGTWSLQPGDQLQIQVWNPQSGGSATVYVTVSASTAARIVPRQILTARQQDGRLSLFALGDDGSVWGISQTSPGGGWDTWQTLGGTAVRQLGVGKAPSGVLELFAVGGNGVVYHTWQADPNGGWNDWTGWNPLGGASVTQLAVGIDQDGREEVFALGAGGAISNIAQTAAGGGWGSFGGFGGGIGLQVATNNEADGRLVVWALGTDRKVYLRWQLKPGGDWSGWTSLGDANIQQIAVASNQDGREQVFALGSGGSIDTNAQSAPNGSYGSFTAIGGNAVQQILAAANADGRLTLFALGGNGQVYAKTQTALNATDWSNWSDLGDANVVQIAAAQQQDGRLAVFALLAGGTVHWAYQTTPNGGWTAFGVLGQNGVISPGSGSGSGSGTSAPPTINSFTADSYTINPGDSTVLRMNVSNATSATIDNGVGSVLLCCGTARVSPNQTTTYTLTVANAAGTRSKSVQIVVAGSSSDPNVALGKPAFESSSTDDPHNFLSPASAAVDGNRDGNFGDGSVTENGTPDSNAYWYVNLQGSYQISGIQIWGRTDCCGSRLDNAIVSVFAAGEDPNGTGTPVWSGRLGTISSASASAQQVGAFAPNVTGQYVRVQLAGDTEPWLSLAEVEVYGTPGGGGSGSGGSTVAAAPSITTFAADSASIAAGGNTILRWAVSGATSVTIDNGVGQVNASSGAQLVSPQSTTTYTLTATNAAGKQTKTVTVTVVAAGTSNGTCTSASPPISGLPSVQWPYVAMRIEAGMKATLRWSYSSCYSSVSITPGVGTFPYGVSSVDVSPTQTTVYTLTASSTTQPKRVDPLTVTVVPKASILSFTATPASITAGQPVTLEWTTANANYVKISPSATYNPNGYQLVAANGSGTFTPTTSTTYTLTAIGMVDDNGMPVGQAATRTVTVTVAPPTGGGTGSGGGTSPVSGPGPVDPTTVPRPGVACGGGNTWVDYVAPINGLTFNNHLWSWANSYVQLTDGNGNGTSTGTNVHVEVGQQSTAFYFGFGTTVAAPITYVVGGGQKGTFAAGQYLVTQAGANSTTIHARYCGGQ